MKNNILNRFAFDDLKTHYKDTIWMSVIIFVVAFVVLLVSYFTPLIQNYRYIESQYENGRDNYVIRYENLQDIDQLELTYNHQPISLDDKHIDTCLEIPSGYSFYDETISELRGNMEVCATRLKSGRLPQNKQEIAVKESVFEHWGYDHQLDQMITISYAYNENSYVKELKVVGILEDTGMTEILVKDFQNQSGDLHIDVKDENMVDELKANHEILYTNGKFSDFQRSRESQAVFLTIIQVALNIIAMTLLYGMTLASFGKRQKDYTLLRSVGATNRQLYYVIFIQCLLLMIVPVTLSLAIIYVLSQIFAHTSLIPIPLPMDGISMMWGIFNVFIVVFISYFIPARSSCRKVLSGSFDGEEHQYFYYRYKKLHNMRPFYLAWRQLVSQKKQMVIKGFFMFLIVVSSLSLVGKPIVQQSISDAYEDKKSKNDVTYRNMVIDENEESHYEPIVPSDFDFIKDYASHITFETFLNNVNYAPDYKYIHFSFPTLYCENESLKEYYQVKDIQENQIVLSGTYLAEEFDNYKVGDMIPFVDRKYELIQVLDNTREDMAIISRENFQNFSDPDQYNNVLVSFEDNQQRSKLYIEQGNEILKLRQKYSYYPDYMFDFNEDDRPVDTIHLFTISVVSVIYIYQFIFELLKQREDIGSYQLLGFTKKEIWSVYFYKALLISCIGFVFGSIYYCLDCYYNHSVTLAHVIFQASHLIPTFLFAFGVVVILICISLIPLFGILKNGGLENKNIRE